MAELRVSARAFFLVSHSLGVDQAALQRRHLAAQGRAHDARGTPDEVIAAYTKFVKVGEDAVILEDL